MSTFIETDVDGYVIAPGATFPSTVAWFTTSTETEIDRLMLAWPDAPEDHAEVLGMLLDIAREQVEAFAPKASVDAVQPSPRIAYAQLQQAINLWNAGSVTPSGEMGPDSYSYTPRPLDKTIRSIIRPTSGAADVF